MSTKVDKRVLYFMEKDNMKTSEYDLAPEVIKLFSYSSHLGMEFIMLINVKMPTIVGI